MQASKPEYLRYKKEKKMNEAISYNSVSETENERFRIARPVWLSDRPENGDFSGFHFPISFSDPLPAEKVGPFSDEINPHPKMASVFFCFPHVIGGKKRRNKSKTES